MIKRFAILAFLALSCSIAFSQEKSVERYITTGGEIIFSFAAVNDNGSEDGSILRFSPVFNTQFLYNFDPTPEMGIFLGFSIRNVGFIYDIPDSDIRKKYRTYNFGIPAGLKFGNMNNSFLYGGYEFELPFHYKEKTFISERKDDVLKVWFSKRVPTYYHSFFVGFQFAHSFNLKFKYYLTGFFNQNFTTIVGGQPVKPFYNFDANVFYFSINKNLFRGKKPVNDIKL